MTDTKSKVTDLKHAIEKNVKDGDHLILGNYTVAACNAQVAEVIRQKKRHLTAYSQSGGLDLELLIAGGCVDKVVSTFVSVTSGTGALARSIKSGDIELEEYSNFQYNARLQAGMYGFSFMQVLEGGLESDLYKKRTFMGENKYKVIECPYTHKKILTVPAANPDICIVHVQRADEYGNAQYWGSMGSTQAAALASKKIIVSCEELVDHDVIRSSPHHTIIPSFRADAVVELPFGAHPNQVPGYYYLDSWFYYLLGALDKTQEGMDKFLQDWIYGCKDHDDYVNNFIDIFGIKYFNFLKTKKFFSAPANYGPALRSFWDYKGNHRQLGMSYKQIEKLIEEEGMSND